MDIHEIILKINAYSKLARERELSEEEKIDRQKYRKMYLEIFREQVKKELDRIEIVD